MDALTMSEPKFLVDLTVPSPPVPPESAGATTRSKSRSAAEGAPREDEVEYLMKLAKYEADLDQFRGGIRTPRVRALQAHTGLE